MAVTLGFARDVVLGRNVDPRQRSRSVDAVWDDVLSLLDDLDAFFVNLE